ncbi:MAG TPA: FAD-dependent oxidoreductase, partial [Desulfotomaculum sp.]|nr:FAD-dependent oxidoreductase [Desulfotomaculum sp.]
AIPGVNENIVVSAWDVLAGKVKLGKRVAVVGGGSVGCETADFLSAQGKQVTLVEKLDEIGHDLVERVKYFLMPRLAQAGVQIFTSTHVLEILSDGIKVEQRGKAQELRGYDNVVLSLGTRPLNSLEKELSGSGVYYSVIGDAKKPGNAMEAIREAAEIARKI